jgi:hypothetical protein
MGSGWNRPIWHLWGIGISRNRMDVDFSSAPCGKPALKQAKMRCRGWGMGIGYAGVEHSYSSTFKEDYEWQLA